MSTERSRAPSAGRASVSPVHRAKLRRPAPAEHYVRRPRLLDLVEQVLAAPLTLVVAPAGTGKTSLVAGWLREASVESAWLSLDALDRDVVELWSGVIAAVGTLLPGCGDDALAVLRQPSAGDDAVDQLLTDLDAAERPRAVLVIDDFHLVDDEPAVTASLTRFALGLPAWLRVVILSRRDPPLPIDRLRSRGQLGEIRFGELRFSPDEAVELLRRMAPDLTAPRVETAVARADGWAASLQLMALAARSKRARAIDTAPGPDGDALIQDYVLHEVLAGEAPEVIDVLAATAVVPRINAGLASAITLRPDAGELLRTAEARGLFLTRRGAGGWFDLHALVRDVMTADLASRSPSRLSELHGRAATWFEDAGEVVLALEQWLLADRPRDALRLLSVSHGPLYDSGRQATVARTIGAIPMFVAVGDLAAMVDYAWCHLLVDRRRFTELVEQLAWWAERSAPDRVLRARVDMLRGSAAVVNGWFAESGAIDRQVVVDLGESCWQDPLARFALNGVARAVAWSEGWDENDDEVRRTEAALSRDPQRRLAFEGTRALGEALAGRPLDALRVAAGVRRAAQVSEMTIMRDELTVAEALAHREIGDRHRALAELTAFADAPAETMICYRVVAMCELARAHLDAGDVDAAGLALGAAEQVVESESLGVDVRNWTARVGTLVALAAGDADRARRCAEQVDDSFWSAIGIARLALAVDDREEANAGLDAAAPRCVRHEVVLALLRARAAADRDDAMKHAGSAVELATASGMLQTVASEGPAVFELVEHAAWRVPAEWLDRLRRCTAEVTGGWELVERGLVEPLTERERDVLRFLPSRLTVREIADELYVSVNTVKFHLRVIYRKLGVNTRAEATEAARKLSALHR